MKQQVLGTLVGNTGDPTKVMMVIASSFSARRGEFVRISHQERDDEQTCDVLGRIASISRVNALYDAGMGSSLTELELMPGARVTGESRTRKVVVWKYVPKERIRNKKGHRQFQTRLLIDRIEA